MAAPYGDWDMVDDEAFPFFTQDSIVEVHDRPVFDVTDALFLSVKEIYQTMGDEQRQVFLQALAKEYFGSAEEMNPDAIEYLEYSEVDGFRGGKVATTNAFAGLLCAAVNE